MRLTRLEAQNVLSFDTFELSLDPQRTVIVGPNGSGKTNLTRLLALIGSALARVDTEDPRGPAVAPGPAAQILDGFARARHLPDSGGPQLVRLGIELTTEPEQEALLRFLRAAALWSLLEVVGQGPAHARALANWVMAGVTVETCLALFKGTIVAEHPGMRGYGWTVGYEFTAGEPAQSYRWILHAPNWHSTILTAADAVSPAPGLIRATDALSQRLLGVGKGGSVPAELPDPLPPFSLDMVLPKSGEAVRLMAGERNTFLDTQYEPFRAYMDIEPLRTPLPSVPGTSLAAVLGRIYQAALVLVGEQLRGIGNWGQPQPAAEQYRWPDVANPWLGSQPHLLPLRLLRLKNGTVDDRRRFLEIQEQFGRLAPGRRFDLLFEAGSSQQTGTDGGGNAEVRVEVLVSRVDPTGLGEAAAAPLELPIQLWGAGAWEALVLAEALYGPEHRVVVLDEPATGLHPTWQKALAGQLEESEAQLLLITHSPDLIRIEQLEDLAHLTRFTQADGATRVHAVTTNRLEALATMPSPGLGQELLRKLKLSNVLRTCLFSRAVVLLEGETESAVLPQWFARCAQDAGLATPAALDLAFYEAGGDKSFTAPLVLLAGLGIPWAIVCDGAAFDLSKKQNVFREIVDAGADGELVKLLPTRQTRSMDAPTFKQWVKTGQDHGVFTLARGWTTGDCGDEAFEVYLGEALPKGALDKARQAVGSSKVRKALWIGENYPPPPSISAVYREVVTALKSRGMAEQ